MTPHASGQPVADRKRERHGDALRVVCREVRAEVSGGGVVNPARKTTVEEPLQTLTQRALNAFPKNEAAEVFATVGGAAEGDLLQKYKDISLLSMRKRKELFRQAPAKDRSDLWKVHMALYLAQHPELNKSQSEVIVEAISFVTPEVFDIRADSAAWRAYVEQPLHSLEEHVLAVFTRKEGGEILTRLGGEEPAVSKIESDKSGDAQLKLGSWMSTSLFTKGILSPMINTSAVPEPDCECSTQSNWCWDRCSGVGCHHTDSGCGTLWMYPCNAAACQDELNC